MKKGASIDLQDVSRGLSRLLYRFHIVIFVVIVIGGMAVVMFLINQTISRATDTTDMSMPLPARFDQQTIDRIGELETDNQQSDINFPGGRINPFSE